MIQALILAGGKGTRLGRLTRHLPKPLIPVADKPVLAYQVELLERHGLSEITMFIHSQGKKIKDFFGNGQKWGVNITYFEETEPLGTAGGIKALEDQLQDDILVLYGDLMVNVDLSRFIKQHQTNKRFRRRCLGTLMVHANDHPHDSDLVGVDERQIVRNFFSKPHPEHLIYRNLVNAALYILSPEICRYIPAGRASDFGKEIFPAVLKKGRHFLFAYKTPEYLKDMGTLQRLREVSRDVETGRFHRDVLTVAKPAVFLDRDGVINEEVNYLSHPEDFRLIPQAGQAIKAINHSNFYAVVITNQPGVAKGFCTIQDILEINKKMETELGKVGAKLDGIYFCPHHPEKGFAGENPKFKVNCRCRKPHTGLIGRAVRELNIDLGKSYFIGDTTRDAMAAQKAGVKFVGVKTGYGLKDGKFALNPDQSVIKWDLYAAVRHILKQG